MQPDSLAIPSWSDAERIRAAIESDDAPQVDSEPPRRHMGVKIIERNRQLNPENAASRRWHTAKANARKKAGLNWLGLPYKNERRTRPLVHPDLPPKLYLDHAAYMAAWRAKKKAAK